MMWYCSEQPCVLLLAVKEKVGDQNRSEQLFLIYGPSSALLLLQDCKKARSSKRTRLERSTPSWQMMLLKSQHTSKAPSSRSSSRPDNKPCRTRLLEARLY